MRHGRLRKRDDIESVFRIDQELSRIGVEQELLNWPRRAILKRDLSFDSNNWIWVLLGVGNSHDPDHFAGLGETEEFSIVTPGHFLDTEEAPRSVEVDELPPLRVM